MPIEISFTNRNQTLKYFVLDLQRLIKDFKAISFQNYKTLGIPQFQRPEAFTSSTWSYIDM